MKYLAIDTSGKNLTVILNNNGKFYRVFDSECGVNHSVELMPKVEQVCESAQFNLKDVDFFACVVGPGSFTGIRIGVATVKAMCFAYKKPCLAVTSFDTLAYNENGGKILTLIDAKHNGFYVCGYENDAVILQPSYLMRESVEEVVKEYHKILSFTEIENIPCKIVSVADGLQNAIDKKINEITEDIEALTPLYVRKSQAEEGR